MVTTRGDQPAYLVEEQALEAGKYNHWFDVKNTLPVSVQIWSWWNDGKKDHPRFQHVGEWAPGQTKGIGSDQPPPPTFNCTYTIWFSGSDSFVSTLTATKVNSTVTISKSDLFSPNAIGYPPAPTAKLGLPIRTSIPSDHTVILPQDSEPILVGAGIDVWKNVISREQYWAKSPDSYSLGPNESFEQALEEVSGVTQSSSSIETVAKAIGMEASAGWGPVSASVSASLSSESTVAQEMTISSQTTNSVIQVLKNPTSTGLFVLRWQLMNRLTWWKPGTTEFVVGNVLASLTTGHQPLIPVPYNIKGQEIDWATGIALVELEKIAVNGGSKIPIGTAPGEQN